jgi:1-acyl-sn-glycerol-3-phosphate acyltransferase
LDATTPPLSNAQAYVLLLFVPLFFLRLLGLVVSLCAYLALLLLLQHHTDDTDAPNFRCYPLVLRASTGVARAVLACLGFRLRVRGSEHLAAAYARRTATIVVCNHVSYIDVFAIAAAVGPYFPVARLDVGRWPLFGRMIALWGFAGVDRSKAATGDSVTARICERAKRTGAWRAHPPLLVFPEGTCTTGDALLRFKSGAFVAAQPVLPIAIRYRTGNLNAGWVWRERPTRVRAFRSWPLDLLHLLRILVRWGNAVELTVLPPYTPTAAEAKDPALFAAGVRAAMAAALGVPAEDCGSMDDARAFYSSQDESYAKTS